MSSIRRQRWNSPPKFSRFIKHSSKLSNPRKDCIIMTWPLLQRSDEWVCVWSCLKRGEKKDWQEKIQLFWRSLYYTWKDSVSEASWELHTGKKICHLFRFFTAPLFAQGNQATLWQATAVSIRTDVNALVHIHMSRSCARLVGLNGDDNPERHDCKCCIIRKMGN